MGCPFNYCRVIEDDCPRCEEVAESRALDPGYAGDWQTGQDRYERDRA